MVFYTKKHHPMEPNENVITVSKEFKVPVGRLYEAWIEPEHLKQWWKPMNMTLTEVVNEVKSEGNINYKFEGTADAGFSINGNYQEVKPEEKLVYTWNWAFPDEKLNSQYKLEVSFQGSDSGSRIEVTQQEEANQDLVKPKGDGWNQALDKLASYLESSATAGSTESSNANEAGTTSTAPIGNTQHTDASSNTEDQEGKPDYGSQHPLENQ